jgi:Na+/pantothenate symporter
VLTPVAGSLLIVAAFSAIMSTVNALLLVASASVVHDIFVPIVRPLAGDRVQLAANRVGVIALALVPVWFAVHEVPLVQFIVLFQAKLVASFFFAPIVIGLNWRRATPAAALASMLAGLVVCIWWSVPAKPPLGVDAIFPGVAASILVFVAVSSTAPTAARSPARASLR